MNQESCLTTFWNGGEIVEIGFSRWAGSGSWWAPAGKTEFLMPADATRVVVELPTGCIEWTTGATIPRGGTFTISLGDGSGESFRSCQQVAPVPVAAPPKVGLIAELIDVLTGTKR